MPYNKNDFKESNVNYLNKDFGQLKRALVDYAQAYYPNTYRDFNETSPGMMLLEMNAYVGDVLSFYIDQQYREMMLPLAEERRNIINMAKMFGYKVKPIVPSYVNLTFKATVNASGDDYSKIDYTNAAVFNTGIKVKSNANPNIVFETLEEVDFTISQSGDTDTVKAVDGVTGVATSYTLSREAKAVSGETLSKAFTITSPTKFLNLTLQEKNVIDIISVVDTNGNDWYEVDFLAQDKVPLSVHYTEEARTNAYYNLDDSKFETDVAVPYSLSYIKTSKRFVRETNEDSTTSLVFGNGILRNGQSIEDGYLDLEQVGIVVPGSSQDINAAVDPLLGDEYSTLGETPIQTTLVVTYRVGGGIVSNTSTNELTKASNITSTPTGKSIESVTNLIPARGGKDTEDIDEIRQKTKAFFSTQNRAVTKEDYEARVLNIPSKYGNIAKAYVARSDIVTPTSVSTQQAKADIGSAVAAATLHLTGEGGAISQLEAAGIALGGGDYDGTAALIDAGMSEVSDGQDDIDLIPSALALIPDNLITLDLGTIVISVLSYDRNKNLAGNALAGTSSLLEATDGLPQILKDNIKAYMNNFRLLTDEINIQDGYIINFGVFFDVIAHKHADKNEVKLLCIETIKRYFKIEKMQFSQPIFISNLEYELMDIDGVRAVNYVTITQEADYNGGAAPQSLPERTYYYSLSNGEVFETGTSGYGYKYDFSSGDSGALVNGIILPPSPTNPGIFELKNPNQNIMGVVR